MTESSSCTYSSAIKTAFHILEIEEQFLILILYSTFKDCRIYELEPEMALQIYLTLSSWRIYLHDLEMSLN